jgi:hypothetical protein
MESNLLIRFQINFIQEPRKSDAPQLRDEYRTYKILNQSSMCCILSFQSILNEKNIIFQSLLIL